MSKTLPSSSSAAVPKSSGRSQERELIFQLVETTRHVRQQIERVARQHGTTRAQWSLLARLNRMNGPSQNDLADVMELAPITVGRMVDRMAEQGLIERRADALDRRINRLYLTDAGRSALAALDPQRAVVAGQALAGISPAEVAIALAVIERVQANVRACLNEATP
jgi:DNA-binding MarR family transcriptional regulator